VAEFPQAYISMGVTAENLAKKYDIDRKRQQEFSVQSHAKAAAAQAAGKFVDEIVPIIEGNTRIEQDGSIRADTTQEVLDGLQPAFDQNGTVTAGTSSPLTDGAAAVLVCSEDYADRRRLNKLARIRAIAVAGVPPEIMGIGPVAATEKVLERGKIELDQVDLIEINEAFAAQAEACLIAAKMPREKINLDGGAIALGHPLGASGARITGKAAQLLKREGKRYGLATMCIGGGQGIATLLEIC
jgi:acetyl-CoA acyltransferase